MAKLTYQITVRPDPGYLENRTTRDFIEGLHAALELEGKAKNLTVIKTTNAYGDPKFVGKLTIERDDV